MIYLDTCYILKCYLTEHGSEEVRQLTQSANGLASCELARVEFSAAVHRHRREGKLSEIDAKKVFTHFRADEKSGLWKWYPLTRTLLDDVFNDYQNLDSSVFVRSNDAIHLACARQQGFREIHSNDRHLLKSAAAFSLQGINVIP
ncbi:MAG: type II toxin-antitoxin system VapC family toxin [Verrucomicrobiota bacterium]